MESISIVMKTIYRQNPVRGSFYDYRYSLRRHLNLLTINYNQLNYVIGVILRQRPNYKNKYIMFATNATQHMFRPIFMRRS